MGGLYGWAAGFYGWAIRLVRGVVVRRCRVGFARPPDRGVRGLARRCRVGFGATVRKSGGRAVCCLDCFYTVFTLHLHCFYTAFTLLFPLYSVGMLDSCVCEIGRPTHRGHPRRAEGGWGEARRASDGFAAARAACPRLLPVVPGGQPGQC